MRRWYALANRDSVSTSAYGEVTIRVALDNLGRLDIVINSADILSDKTFAKLTPEELNGFLEGTSSAPFACHS